MIINSMSQRLYTKHKEGSGLTGGNGVEKLEGSSKFIFGKLCTNELYIIMLRKNRTLINKNNSIRSKDRAFTYSVEGFPISISP